MAIPFIAGVIVGAVGFYAYKNKDNLKGKSKELLKIVKQKSESVKKDIESKISLPKNKLKVQKSETTNKKDIKPKRKYTKKLSKKEKVNLHKYFWNLESKEPNIIDLGEVNI